MNECPYCGGDLGDLDEVMETLHTFGGQTNFNSRCCNKPIKAYNQAGMYYIVALENLDAEPRLIGAA